MGPARELHVHEHHLDPGRTQPIDAVLNCLAELVEIRVVHRIRRTRLADHERRFQGDHLAVQEMASLLARLMCHGAVVSRHTRGREAAAEGYGETRWPGEIGAARRMSER